MRRYVETRGLSPPLGLNELLGHTRRCLADGDWPAETARYAAILLSNAVWEDTLAGIPFNRRLLLLPQCLRNQQICTAAIDAYGLTCDGCGGCMIDEFLAEADRLGYVTLVAEGSALVMSLIASGQVEAVIGVSCLDALEQVFPYMEAGAVPGLAIPLLRDGCEQTGVDSDWVWRAMYLSADAPAHRRNVGALRAEVDRWFVPSALTELLGPPDGVTERIGRDWLARAGKRWRPLLLVAAWQALSDSAEADDIPANVRRLALAVECFHKASLVHDDIEDGDATRYGRRTLHAAHGVPVALNVGDLLIGEGYRLIADCGRDGLPHASVAAMLSVAAMGHRTLCLGQGDDLDWARHPHRLDLSTVLDIVQRKTAPPFEVALRLGSLAAGADGPELHDVLGEYSRAIGIAYQVRDDLHDLEAPGGPDDLTARRPSVLLALADRAAATDPFAAADLQVAWQCQPLSGAQADRLRQTLRRLNVEGLARDLLDDCKRQAVAAVGRAGEPALKPLLHRLIGKIVYDVETMTCCTDRRAPNAGPARDHS
ncbi:MAG: DUF116 domain-containing protein [Planctomycetes bacterium]|nr:DUF116 domain-containing protein [Planctomycetota bacterium]